MKNNLCNSKFNHTTLISSSNKKRKLQNIHITDDTQTKKIKFDSDWIAATSTRNSILNDGFLDLIEMKSSLLHKIDIDYSNKIIQCSKSYRTKNFTTSIIEQGKIFENKIIDLLNNKFNDKEIINIYGNLNSYSDLKYEETIQAIKNNVPIIISGIVRNYNNKTFGIPDLIVRSDYISKFITLDPLSNELNNDKYYYYIIDIKLMTLHLMCDGEHLRNSGSVPAYKAQLYIYNEALAQMQNYNPRKSFILGWKWKYTSKNTEYRGTNCFDRLGVVDFRGRDKDYVQRTKDSIEWLRELKTNGDKWNLNVLPLPHKNLYPNMCNHMDFPYRKIKEMFAKSIDDITLLWQCGPKQRNKAHDAEIYSWTDPECTVELLGFKNGIKSKILTRILEANNSDTDQNIIPRYIKSNLGGWKNKKDLELYVDFESTCSVFNNFESLPNSSAESIIYMIGVGYTDNNNDNKWIYKSFVVKNLDYNEEFKICNEFNSYIQKLIYNNNINPLVLHWSHAEPTMWKRVIKRNPEKVKSWININWYDLLKLFHCEPIGIRGCLSYGLKEIANSFYNHGFISTIWDSSSSCVSGIDASVGAFTAWNEAKQKQLSLIQIPLIREIERYNEIDCKVLEEIIRHLRINCINNNEDTIDNSDNNDDNDDDSTIEDV